MSTAILLVNLGTPEAPTAAALRIYLAEFLADRRVVDLPRAIWWPVLHGIVLRTRPEKSAAKYARIWTRDGSPLRLHTERQAKLVKGLLGHHGYQDITATWAMRYGQPSIASVLDGLAGSGVRQVLVLPLYPQYAGSSTGSTEDALAAWQRRHPDGPAILTVRDYHDHSGYISVLAQTVRDHWMAHGRAEQLVMSFHGIPTRAVRRGDPYADQCRRTAELLATDLNLPRDTWQMTFQSRFGAAEWLQPYTQPTLERLARQGIRRVDVICPGFAGDCLETLEEIGIECRDAYLAAGGREFRYIPCLNERPDWIAALTDVALKRLGA
ncbi:MAG TPA: ferrochelatase [Rhodocyclaceae bacterium]|nr:ferrochelatase [Rhodocyclaceae bacterium]